MKWDSLVLLILGMSGALSVLLAQTRDVLVKITEVVHAWHELRRSIRAADRDAEREERASG